MRAWHSIIILFLLGSLAPKASGQQLAKLLASDAAADDYFGYSVAISGDLLVVGAYKDDDAGSKTGSAYVFRTTNDGASWTLTAKLVASDAAKDNYFGKSVAISGDLVVVGADGRNEDVGSAYVFRTRNGGASWSQTAKLLASDAAADDHRYSAASGDSPSPGVRERRLRPPGSAYVFRTRNSGAS
ncbi:hypothetical protein JL721_7205 [Aureococcus anophagefferens]|nr:hypothetical protein JL721_7205 [Aureococcus anophagefferens]